MRILCAYSGIDCKIDHFPAYLHAREAYHPIFAIEQKKLFQYIHKWKDGSLTSIDSYLLYLALFNSTDLIEWRSPAKYSKDTDKIVSSNMESLVRIIGKINLVSNPSFVLHRIAITPATATLENSKHWIENWTKSFDDFQSGYSTKELREQIKERENKMLKWINDTATPVSRYAKTLSEWAAMAADFPIQTIMPDKEPIATTTYWKQLICKCANSEIYINLPTMEIRKLIEYLELNLEMGSSYSYRLMNLLRSSLQKQSESLGLPTFDSPNYQMIADGEVAGNLTEAANIIQMIKNAPEDKPQLSNYPSKFAYLKAKIAWETKELYAEEAEVIKNESVELVEEFVKENT